MLKQLQLAVVALLATIPGVALAAAQDYTGITTAFGLEMTAAMPVVLGVFGAIFGIGVAFKLIKKARGA